MIIVVVGLLFNFLGVSAFAGISIILVMFPLNFLLANLLGKFQKQTLKCTDQRISKLNECLQNIRIVKYFAWERNIINEIKSIRQKELRSLLKKIFGVVRNFFSLVRDTDLGDRCHFRHLYICST
ncbi:BEM_collapsed_G0024310.mRNA.1.CDS.1 [Saccharomyces cerevisiae]|nr:BEM_collapsed_G0024310.mRNA.1.CDS.1 [Saccharomyces cerevisiae]